MNYMIWQDHGQISKCIHGPEPGDSSNMALFGFQSQAYTLRKFHPPLLTSLAL
jgi:hypothetical protein